VKKSVYLALPVVQQFVGWLSKNLGSEAFAHHYINRRSGPWQCESLYDAYVKYQWRHRAGNTFAHNATTLTTLSNSLHAALLPPINDADACAAATEVMIWGGVVPGNVRWLNANRRLASDLVAVQAAVNRQDTANPILTDPNLRFNAGMTKIYSLICEGLIIYDSRVAATLGWTVTKFCQSLNVVSVPTELRFPWASAKTTPNHPSPKCRNPSSDSLDFPKLISGPQHAEWNLKASWILEAALLSPAGKASEFACDSRLNTLALQLRAVEAALFMIGYDLNPHAVTHYLAAGSRPDATPSVGPEDTSIASAQLGTWIDCQTLSHRNPFRYRFTLKGIEIEEGPSFSVEEINETLNILWRHFHTDSFPLANSVTDVPAGNAPMGMGTAYHRVTRKSPAFTSKLAPILEDLNIIQPIRTKRASSLHWVLNLALLQLDAPTGAVDIAIVLSELQEDLAES
jgi:hypothetical protein